MKNKVDLDRFGMKIITSKSLWFERYFAFIVLLLPFLGLMSSIFFLWNKLITSLDLILMAGMYLLTGFGITVGFHRLLTHESFRCADWLRAFLAICGSMALQGPVVRWVADHRRHHAYSDRQGDPHSPHVTDTGTGLSSIWKGLWQAHCGWFFSAKKTRLRRFAADLIADPLIKKIDQLYLLWVFLSLALPPLIAFAITGSGMRALEAFVWGSLVRIFLVHHVTWSINSLCHMVGTRPWIAHDQSTNCWWLAIVSLGESWHNGHHAFPTSARHGLRKFEVDLSASLISLLQFLGFASEVKLPSPTMREKKCKLTNKDLPVMAEPRMDC